MTSTSDKSSIKIKINELLNATRIAKTVTEFTHVSMGGNTFPGKFALTEKQCEKLSKYIAKSSSEGLHFSIAEKLQQYAPIMVDIDLKLPKEGHDNSRLYDDKFIKLLVDKYRTSIKKYLNVTDMELTCFVFEKSTTSEKNDQICDGIHFIFPYTTVDPKVRHLVFKTVYDDCIETGLFEKYCNNTDVLDDNIISTNPWLMYGCCKPSGTPYILTQVLDVNNNTSPIDKIGTHKDITQMLSLRDTKWSEINATKLNEDVNLEYIDSAYNNLGRGDDNEKLNNMLNDWIPSDTLEAIEKAVTLINMLKKERSDSFHDWIRVGWALRNTHKCLYDTWVDFSKKSTKYKPGECDTLWRNMKDGGYTIRSIMLWAKEDSPAEYKLFIKEDFENNLRKNCINNTFMIAKALYCKYFDKFVCANPKDNTWYHFSEHRWRKCIGGGRLITLISSEFANHYIEMAQEYTKKALESLGDKKTFLQEAAHFNKIADNLMDINFKKKIMEESKYLFYCDMFLKRLDENHQLIGFENGVYDLDMKKFRSGRPDDHISMSTNVHYTKWSSKNPYAGQINNFFDKILPNKKVRDYFLSRLSTCVSGENREEKFYFCTGSGSNGKSLCFQLVSESLGDYYISCPITIITRKRGASNAASPEMARMKGVRIGVYQEPGTDEIINVGIFKEISGNDKFMVRGLYQEPIEVKSQMKNWMTTNELPEVNSDDGGTWRRLRVIDFNSKFVENPDPERPEEFMLDDTLKNKISQWAPAFASYLIHIYTTKYNVDDKVPEPEEVQCSTNKYRKDQDFVREYYEASIETTTNKMDTLKKKDLYNHFKLWFSEIHNGETLPKAKKIYDFMDKEIKNKYGSNGWPFLRFKIEYKEGGDDEEINDLDLM